MKQILDAAYDLMLGECRCHFRSAVTIPVLLTKMDSKSLECSTLNVSSNGIAVRTPIPFKLGEPLGMPFFSLMASLSVQLHRDLG